MSEFKYMKFRIKSRKHSEKIQKALFRIGVKWGDDSDEVFYCKEQKYLYVYSEFGLTWSDNDNDFSSSSTPEYHLSNGVFVEGAEPEKDVRASARKKIKKVMDKYPELFDSIVYELKNENMNKESSL